MPSYTGTSGKDTLSGSDSVDTLTGLAGDDTYLVNNYDDVVVEASSGGSDTIITTALDSLSTYSLGWWAQVERLTYGGAQAAQLLGNSLSNVLKANSATSTADTLSGGAGNDSLYGYGGNDLLMGGSGNDYLDGGTGDDSLVGGAGNDRYVIDSAGDRVFEAVAAGTDTILSAVMTDLRAGWTQQVEGLVYTGASASTLHGNAHNNTLESKSSSADTLHGYEGNDTLIGGGGADLLAGGAGDDFYRVDASDTVSELVDEGTDAFEGTIVSINTGTYAQTIEQLFYTGGAGAALSGNDLSNLVVGGAGSDTVDGLLGADSLFGGAGADLLNGGGGDDHLYGGGLSGTSSASATVADAGADTLAGGTGNDVYLIDSTLDSITELTAEGEMDVVISTIDNSLSRYAYTEALVLKAGSAAWHGQGTAVADVLIGNEVDNYLSGGSGADTLSGFVNVANAAQDQHDVLDGGIGNDVFVAFDYVASTHAREVSLLGGGGNDTYLLGSSIGYSGYDSAGTDTVILMASGSVAALEGVENIYLRGADLVRDEIAEDAIARVYAVANAGLEFAGSYGMALDATGNDSANKIYGNALNNRLSGGAGNDTVTGGAGHDTLVGGDGVDSLVGGSGNDEYLLDVGDIAVEGSNGGYDILNSATITSFSGYGNFEGLRYLGATAVSLNRGSGNTSADLLAGGSGNDSIHGYGGQDSLSGGLGNDLVSGGVDADLLSGDAGNDTLLGGDGHDTLSGHEGADAMQGDAGNDSLDGHAGLDTVDGGSGNDTLAGGADADSLLGQDGEDVLSGGAGHDTLAGGNGRDTLYGGTGNDVIWVGAQDAIDGAVAGDHLWGDDVDGLNARGQDIFVFDTVTAANSIVETFNGSGEYVFRTAVTIADFRQGYDQIQLSAAMVGDGDLVFDSPTTLAAAGATISSTSEFVFVRANVAIPFADSPAAFFEPLLAADVDSVIGNFDVAVGVGQFRMFVLDDGSNSALFLFQSSDGNASVTVDELFLLGVVTGQAALTTSDFSLY